jgi:hypothetical protein
VLGIRNEITSEEIMKKFEYKVVDSSDVQTAGFFKGRKREDIENYLNSLGAEGWELVNADFRELEGRLEFAGVMKKEV